jgi:hypothetical protein
MIQSFMGKQRRLASVVCLETCVFAEYHVSMEVFEQK